LDQLADQGSDLAAAEDEAQWVRQLDLAAAWAALTPPDRALLLARFQAGKSQAAVARELHLSQAQISRWQARVTARLAKAVEPD
jgi:RNA polymerase sigma factor (sigma-70 family)